MQINRRHILSAFGAGVAASALPRHAAALPVGMQDAAKHSIRLPNGLRAHFIQNDSGYVAATLVLRSKEISHNGLAHICEHTSCVGAAGSMTAAEVTRLNKDHVQDGNASTESGMLQWHASFLPQYLPQVMNLLAATSLDQKFDLETVAAQARVVLEELYLDKYDPDRVAQCKFDRELFGASHPYVKETLPEEIARCKLAPAKLAAELRDFANSVRLPGNMDLFLVGSIEPDAVAKLVNEHFGRFAAAEGPRLDIPHVAVTRAYRSLTETSYELQRPMSDLEARLEHRRLPRQPRRARAAGAERIPQHRPVRRAARKGRRHLYAGGALRDRRLQRRIQHRHLQQQGSAARSRRRCSTSSRR